MRYEKIGKLPDVKFRRLTGVKPKTFEKMLEVLTYVERMEPEIAHRRILRKKLDILQKQTTPTEEMA